MIETQASASDTRPESEAWRSMMERALAQETWTNDDRPLSHDEIDRLMGLDTAPSVAQGPEALAYAAPSPHALYHALRPTGERIAQLFARELRAAFSNLVDVSFAEFSYSRLGVVLTDLPIPSLMARLRLESGLPCAFVAVDAAMAALYFDCIMGGGQVRASVMPGGRAFSAIECRLFEGFGQRAATVVTEGFAAKLKTSLHFDQVETHPRNLALGKSATPTLRIRYQIKMGQRAGIIDVYVVGALLEAIEKEFMPVQPALSAAPDPSWRAKLVAVAAEAVIDLEVVLCEIDLPLSRITGLQIEDIIPLKLSPATPISIRAGRKKIASAVMGRANNRIAVRLVEPVSKTQVYQEDHP